MFWLCCETFQFLRPCLQKGWRGTRNGERTQPGQLTRTTQRGIPYRGTPCLVYVCTWGVAREGRSLLGHWPGIGQRVVSSCLVHHVVLSSFPSGFYSFPSPFHYNCYCHYCYYCSFIFILIQLLNCSTSTLKFYIPFQPSSPSCWVREE